MDMQRIALNSHDYERLTEVTCPLNQFSPGHQQNMKHPLIITSVSLHYHQTSSMCTQHWNIVQQSTRTGPSAHSQQQRVISLLLPTKKADHNIMYSFPSHGHLSFPTLIAVFHP